MFKKLFWRFEIFKNSSCMTAGELKKCNCIYSLYSTGASANVTACQVLGEIFLNPAFSQGFGSSEKQYILQQMIAEEYLTEIHLILCWGFLFSFTLAQIVNHIQCHRTQGMYILVLLCNCNRMKGSTLNCHAFP